MSLPKADFLCALWAAQVIQYPEPIEIPLLLGFVNAYNMIPKTLLEKKAPKEQDTESQEKIEGEGPE